MESINDRLRRTATSGSETELKALLTDPGCDALTKGNLGMTALMWAAWRGRETCVRLLLPVSDAGSKSNTGLTASDWAREEKHESLAQFIDAYTLAQSELASMTVAARKVAPRGRSAPRV